MTKGYVPWKPVTGGLLPPAGFPLDKFPATFTVLNAHVDPDDPFTLMVFLSAAWDSGNVNTGVTIESEINGNQLPISGFTIGGDPYELNYELFDEAEAGEVHTITFSGSAMKDVDGNALQDAVVLTPEYVPSP